MWLYSKDAFALAICVSILEVVCHNVVWRVWSIIYSSMSEKHWQYVPVLQMYYASASYSVHVAICTVIRLHFTGMYYRRPWACAIACLWHFWAYQQEYERRPERGAVNQCMDEHSKEVCRKALLATYVSFYALVNRGTGVKGNHLSRTDQKQR